MSSMFYSIRSIGITVVLFIYSAAYAQKAEIVAVGFYNFENLFDTINSPGVNDYEFTPQGSNKYTGDKYKTKLHNLSKVVSELATDKCPDGVALLGMSEIENRGVLEDFVKQPAVRKRNYQIVHYDSPDRRGVDVGFLYNPRYFKYDTSYTVFIDLVKNGDTTLTRDILVVGGLLNGEYTYVLVNHWPSRSGGEQASLYKRAEAARRCRQVYDQLRADNPMVRLIIMGDLNDDPISPSIAQYLGAVGDVDHLSPEGLYNPMYHYYKQGYGSNAWRDSWSLFDQIILSYGYLEDSSGYRFYKAHIYNPRYLQQSSGQFKGYPLRTYAGGQFIGGYSDHFPVYVYLTREVN